MRVTFAAVLALLATPISLTLAAPVVDSPDAGAVSSTADTSAGSEVADTSDKAGVWQYLCDRLQHNCNSFPWRYHCSPEGFLTYYQFDAVCSNVCNCYWIGIGGAIPYHPGAGSA